MSTYYPHHTEQRHEPSLAITLDVPISSSHSHSHSKPTYKPGDTISGHVYRVDDSFIPEATVMVTLLGQTKTTIRARGPGSSELRYESSFNVFAGCFDTLVLHSKSPLSGPGMSWPFALAIPFSVLDVLTAPFTLTSVSYSPATTDFGNKVETFQRGVSTFRLIPSVEGKLSLAQKTKQAFMSSSVPSLAMRVSVSLPRFLQLDNPEVIPVIVYFEALSGSSDIIERVPQVITITSLTLNLRPKTVLLAEFKPSRGGSPQRKTSKKIGPPVPMLPSTVILDLRRAYDQEICFTVTPGSTGSGANEIEESEPLDLGAILDIRMVNHVHPTFRTYNVARTWDLAWEMELDAAGERVKLGSAHEVVILPRAWEGPPPDAAGESHHHNEQVRAGDLLPGYAGRDEELPPYSA
ncbi:hypothetical protein BJX65DRAFT_283983 [Aspergillus insuetus]